MPYAIRRLASAALLAWIVASIVFLAIHLVPGDPAELLLSSGGAAPDAATVADLRERLGLNLPLLTQYTHFLRGLAHGDLGNSLVDDYPVLDEIALRLPRTLELIAAASVIAIVLGVPAGTWAAMRPNGGFDRAASALAGFVLAIPVFVVGTTLVLLLAQTLHWMPAGGYAPFARAPGQHLRLLALPAFAIGQGLAAVLFRMTRAAVLEATGRDHVRTARAKGLTALRVATHHILRNALSPVLTVLALHMGALLGGTVLVEFVFNWPGLSTPLLRAVEARDYPMVVGIVLVTSTLFLAINLATDLLHAVLDPRIRAQ
jgi:peptide/nickel transport system permease protein